MAFIVERRPDLPGYDFGLDMTNPNQYMEDIKRIRKCFFAAKPAVPERGTADGFCGDDPRNKEHFIWVAVKSWSNLGNEINPVIYMLLNKRSLYTMGFLLNGTFCYFNDAAPDIKDFFKNAIKGGVHVPKPLVVGGEAPAVTAVEQLGYGGRYDDLGGSSNLNILEAKDIRRQNPEYMLKELAVPGTKREFMLMIGFVSEAIRLNVVATMTALLIDMDNKTEKRQVASFVPVGDQVNALTAVFGTRFVTDTNDFALHNILIKLRDKWSQSTECTLLWRPPDANIFREQNTVWINKITKPNLNPCNSEFFGRFFMHSYRSHWKYKSADLRADSGVGTEAALDALKKDYDWVSTHPNNTFDASVKSRPKAGARAEDDERDLQLRRDLDRAPLTGPETNKITRFNLFRQRFAEMSAEQKAVLQGKQGFDLYAMSIYQATSNFDFASARKNIQAFRFILRQWKFSGVLIGVPALSST